MTAVLSLDATVVMLTPVALAADRRRAVRRPLALICSRLANSASLLLPVSNLTILLVVHRVPINLLPWAAVMAVPWLVVVLIEYAAVRLRYADGLTSGPASGSADDAVQEPDPGPTAAAVHRPTAALAIVALMLVAFAVASPLGIDPAWVATGAAVDETVLGRALRRLLDALPLGHVADGDLAALGSLLLLAALATTLTSVLNNLPAVLLLVPLVAPLGTAAVFALVVGVDVGAGLVYTGSLANLLWTRVLHRRGLFPSARAYHRHAALVTPVAVTAAVVVLWAESALGWLP